MYGKIMVAESRFHDFRHITLTMAGFIGGPVSAAIAAIISSLYRYNMGGTGSMGGVIGIIVLACFGTFLGKCVKSKQNGKQVVFWVNISIVMACISLFIIGFIPPWKDDSIRVLQVVSAPYLIITPLATTIIFNFYFWTNEFFGKASILNAILNHSTMNLMIYDNYGPIVVSKNLKMLHQSSRKFEELFRLTDTDLSCLNTTKQLYREITTEDERDFVIELSNFQMPSGGYACVAIVNDVTDWKREQEKLRGATDRFSKAFQLGPHMMTIVRKSDNRYIDVNHRFLEERNFTREDVIGKTPIEIGVPESELNQIMDIIETQGSLHNYEGSMVSKSGSIGTIYLSAAKIEIDDQECIMFAYNDVTEMKRLQTEKVEQLQKYLLLEADLSRSNRLIADIINSMPDSFYVLDDQGRFIFVNNQAEHLLQKPREMLLGKNCWELFPQARGTLLELHYEKSKNDRLTFTFEHKSILHKDKWYQITGYPSQFGLSVYYRDITEQKLAQENLNKSKEETVSILESMTDSFFAINGDWKFTYVNGPAEKAFGKSREELLGKKLTEVFKLHDTSLLNYQVAMNEKRSITYEVVSEMLDNTWVEIKLYPIENGLTIYFQDISSRKKSEEEMARLDRLNLVGQLAAGIGHEIRNPMTTVRGYLQLLGVKPEYTAQKSTFELMISELDRANSIITEFLSLAQTRRTELKSQNLNDIIDYLFPLLEADAFNQNKEIRFIPGEIPNLALNAKEISQLILNLTRNGLEAMEERGCLTLESNLLDGEVVLIIEDEGCGIPSENTSKLGTPFFTTKDSGTGLGLATCYRIVESHNAKICVDSNPSGTTFYITFPVPIKGNEQQEMIA